MLQKINIMRMVIKIRNKQECGLNHEIIGNIKN